METLYFPSKKDLGLGLFIWGVIGLTFFFVLRAMITEPRMGPAIFTLAIFFLVIVGTGILWFGTGYQITETHLLVWLGPFQYSAIPLEQITSLRRSHTWISSPANSLTRLRVGYAKRSELFISPEREKEFVEAILAVNPEVEIFLNP